MSELRFPIIIHGEAHTPDGRLVAECGTENGYRRHRRWGEETCAECRAAHAAAAKAQRRRPSRPKPACGTYNGYMAHYRKDEKACFECRVAAAQYRAQLRASAA